MDVQRVARAGERYDAVIVGARIAGTATALGLARRGGRVLLLDADTFPSDTLSTHLLWSDALQCLDRLGVLPAVRATGAPTISHFQITYGPYTNMAAIPTRHSYPPLLSVRRLVLDDILLRRARATPNITIREGVTVISLLREGETVVGVRGIARDTGAEMIAQGRIIVGADGRRSTVARAVAATEYDVVKPLLATYYRYYRGVQPLAAATLEAFRDEAGGFCYLFPCDDQLWTLAVSFPQEQFDRVRRDHEVALAAQIADKAGLLDRLAGAEAVTPWRGAGDLQNFFRVPYGHGWALVGDAGYHRDPITGRGIADALRSAELLSAALTGVWRGRTTQGAALAAYQQARDALVRPLYDFTVERPPADVAPGDWSGALARTISDPDFLSAYIGFMANVTPPEAFYSAAAVYAPAAG
ncbi:MAG TPA: NAD(P)/FAD-dependent oxidoreductase [Thermomicrobiales bacterium]|jgi:2-polyprenyl-6-methoxyphenol hydroxylase-like FAD-dependent oxidoreductase